MIITHKLQSMDLTHKQNTSRIDVVQDDKYSRDVEFTLTENGVAWQIPDGTTAVVRYKKPDGTGGNYDALPDGSTAYQINGNVLTVAMAPQVCTVTGSVQLSVGLIQGNAEINTFSVNIVVHPNPGAEYQSEDYIKLSGAVPNSGWTPNMYLGTDASGNVVAKEGTGGGGSTSGKDGGYYTPSVTQPDENTMRVSYTPSESSMPEVESMDVMLPTGTDGKSAYQYAVEGGYTGTETEFAAKLAEEMPDKLPNPNALTFTGAVTGSYDGSAPLSVNIPESGGGTGGSSGLETAAEAQLATGTITPVETTTYTPTGITLGDLRTYRRFMFVWDGASNAGATNTLLQFSNASLYTNDIARWSEGGMVYVFEWCDAEKTLLRTCATNGGNPSIVPNVGSTYIKNGSYNQSTAGVLFGNEGMLLFSTKLARLNDSSELFIVNTSKITIDYQWEIRGVTI